MSETLHEYGITLAEVEAGEDGKISFNVTFPNRIVFRLWASPASTSPRDDVAKRAVTMWENVREPTAATATTTIEVPMRGGAWPRR